MAATEAAGLAPVDARPRHSRRQLADLVLHLARRELTSAHRFTLLGWSWPLLRQLAQLGVLVLVFSKVLDAGIDDYAAYVFTGLVLFTWFSSGLSAATTSLIAGRHLVFSPRFPAIALPLVAVTVPLLDALMAVPVLLLIVALQDGLHASALLLPVLLALEFGLIAGLGLLVAALDVFVRDVQNVVTVALMLLFYLTPVFYGLHALPPEYAGLLRINPMTALVESARAILLGGGLPGLGDLARIAVADAIALAAGLTAFRRLEGRFVDEL